MSASAGQVFTGSVRILSDLHLGHDASGIRKVSQLKPLLEGATTVVFNGDTCEQHYSAWRAKGERMRADLMELCADLGVKPVFLRGNHDPGISTIGWIKMAGGKILVTHGDLILENPSPWSREFLSRKKEILALLDERGAGDGSLQYRWETLQLVNEALVPKVEVPRKNLFESQFFNAIWPLERFTQILRVWVMMGGNAETFVTRFAPECRIFLFGHFHRAAVMERGGRLFCNTGAYIAGSKSLVVDLNDRELVVRKVVRDEGFHPGEVVKRQGL